MAYAHAPKTKANLNHTQLAENTLYGCESQFGHFHINRGKPPQKGGFVIGD